LCNAQVSDLHLRIVQVNTSLADRVSIDCNDDQLAEVIQFTIETELSLTITHRLWLQVKLLEWGSFHEIVEFRMHA